MVLMGGVVNVVPHAFFRQIAQTIKFWNPGYQVMELIEGGVRKDVRPEDATTNLVKMVTSIIFIMTLTFSVDRARRIYGGDVLVSKSAEKETTIQKDQAAAAAEYDSDKRFRLLRFVFLWTLMVFQVVGFGPAYVLRAYEHPWYFDAIRKIGPNMDEKGTSVHAICGVLWVLVILHQTATAFKGGIARNSFTGKSWHAISHRVVGYFGGVLGTMVSASGLWIFFGSTVSRQPDKLAVALDGLMVILNVVAGILHVRRGDIAEHKQYMSWAIVWTSWPGFLRTFGYINTLLRAGISPPAFCQQLQTDAAPHYCELVAFVMTQCGIGLWPSCLSFGCCALVGCAMAARLDCWRSGIQVGNLGTIIVLCIFTFPPLMAPLMHQFYGPERWKTCTGFSTEVLSLSD